MESRAGEEKDVDVTGAVTDVTAPSREEGSALEAGNSAVAELVLMEVGCEGEAAVPVPAAIARGGEE